MYFIFKFSMAYDLFAVSVLEIGPASGNSSISCSIELSDPDIENCVNNQIIFGIPFLVKAIIIGIQVY